MLFFFTRDSGVPIEPKHNVAIVSMAVGGTYLDTWKRLCQQSWEQYAKDYGFDIIMIADFLEVTSKTITRSPAWQKLLILSQPWSKLYERIIWIDADIVIAPHAWNIMDCVPDETKVGITLSGDRMSASEKHIYVERHSKAQYKPYKDDVCWDLANSNNFQIYGITKEHGPMLNTGVMVLSPVHHEVLFLEVYNQDVALGRQHEQPYLAYLLNTRGLVHKISARFNWGIYETLVLFMPEKTFTSGPFSEDQKREVEYLVRREFQNSYFLHFWSCMEIMEMLPSGIFEYSDRR